MTLEGDNVNNFLLPAGYKSRNADVGQVVLDVGGQETALPTNAACLLGDFALE